MRITQEQRQVLKIVLDFVERWNKMDEEIVVAEAQNIMEKEQIKKEEFYPSTPSGQAYLSTDVWQCKCGTWNNMHEKCIHLVQDGKIIYNSKEELN